MNSRIRTGLSAFFRAVLMVACGGSDAFPRWIAASEQGSLRLSPHWPSAAVAFAYRPSRRVRFSVNDWRRRFAAPGHGVACDAPRHGRLVYYSVFVTSGFA